MRDLNSYADTAKWERCDKVNYRRFTFWGSAAPGEGGLTREEAALFTAVGERGGRHAAAVVPFRRGVSVGRRGLRPLLGTGISGTLCSPPNRLDNGHRDRARREYRGRGPRGQADSRCRRRGPRRGSRSSNNCSPGNTRLPAQGEPGDRWAGGLHCPGWLPVPPSVLGGVWQPSSPRPHRLRDYLRLQPEQAVAYGWEKRRHEHLLATDREAYVAGKGSFVRALLAESRVRV